MRLNNLNYECTIYQVFNLEQANFFRIIKQPKMETPAEHETSVETHCNASLQKTTKHLKGKPTLNYEEKLKKFHETMDDCIKQVWQKLNEEQKEEAERILIKAWKEEEKEGFEYTESQILASFLSNQILYPCFDAVFKAIFLNDNDYVLLKDLIFWTIFQGKRKVVELKVTSTEPVISLFGDKIFKCDIIVTLDSKEKCNVEMQLAQYKGLSSRMVIQTAKLHASQIKRGMEYFAIKPTFALWIMPFNFTKLETCYNSARLRYDQSPKDVMSDDIQIHFLEFNKPMAKNTQNGLELWCKFFSLKTFEDYKKLKETGEIMERATNSLASLSNNPDFRKNVVEETFKEIGRKIEIGSYYEEGREKGRQEGEIKGRQEGEIKGAIKGIETALDIKFGDSGLSFMPQILEINDVDKLTQILKSIKQVKDQDEFGKMLEKIVK